MPLAVMAKDLPGALARQVRWTASSGNELIPFTDHVVVFVHDGVPAGDAAHSVVIGAAIALGAGLLQKRAVGRFDIADGGLAFHPIAPFVRRHVGLGGGEDGGIIALA